jgi:hypothetical protein
MQTEHVYSNITQLGNMLNFISIYPHLRAGQRTKHLSIRKLLATTGHFRCIAILIHYEIINLVQVVEKKYSGTIIKGGRRNNACLEVVIARVN